MIQPHDAGVVHPDPHAGNILDRYPFAAGDIALIGPDVLYQVRNDSPTMPLCAWVCFPSGTDSFWPDGRKA